MILELLLFSSSSALTAASFVEKTRDALALPLLLLSLFLSVAPLVNSLTRSLSPLPLKARFSKEKSERENFFLFLNFYETLNVLEKQKKLFPSLSGTSSFYIFPSAHPFFTCR